MSQQAKKGTKMKTFATDDIEAYLKEHPSGTLGEFLAFVDTGVKAANTWTMDYVQLVRISWISSLLLTRHAEGN
jgi:hypothetical protein